MARIKTITGDTISMTTDAKHKAIPRDATEIKHYASSAYRLGLAPSLERVFYYTAAAGTYTDYTSQARDRLSTTHVPLDAMLAADILYMGFTYCPRGAYFDIGTTPNDQNRTLDVEYTYDASDGTYLKLTGTVSGALTVGETVTGQTSGTTATLVYSGATYIVVKSASAPFTIGEDVDGSAETCDDITAIATESNGTPYFTDVASDSDGTDSTGTLAVDGLYSWTLPASVTATVNGASGLHWIRFSPSGTLGTTVDINEIIPACATTDYGYFEAGVEYEYPIDRIWVGALETDMAAGSATLNITWVRT